MRQTAFVQLPQDRPEVLRMVGDLAGDFAIMAATYLLGTYPASPQRCWP